MGVTPTIAGITQTAEAEALLEGLVRANMAALRRHPLPSVYAAGVRYAREPRGQERWQLAPEVARRKRGDCEDLAAWRAAELRVAGERGARVAVVRTGRRLLHAVVRRASGQLEDPSARLGMKGGSVRRQRMGSIGVEIGAAPPSVQRQLLQYATPEQYANPGVLWRVQAAPGMQAPAPALAYLPAGLPYGFALPGFGPPQGQDPYRAQMVVPTATGPKQLTATAATPKSAFASVLSEAQALPGLPPEARLAVSAAGLLETLPWKAMGKGVSKLFKKRKKKKRRRPRLPQEVEAW